MGKIPLYEELKLKQYSWVGPHYYDHPEGEDLLGKLYFTSTFAGMVGIFMGTYYATLWEFSFKPLSAKILLTAKFTLPCIGVATVFTTTTFFSTRLRKKDDELNYVIGGLASGLLLGAMTPYRHLGPTGALVFALTGYVKKHYQLQGKKVFPHCVKNQFPNYIKRKFNTSIVSEKPGNWTKDL